MKKLLFGTTLLLAVLLAGCSNTSTSSSKAASSTTSEPASASAPASQSSSSTAASMSESTAASTPASGAQLELTAEELSKYNGKDGAPAYVAVDGVIYDVSNAPEWNNGQHKDGITAGKDLTDEITNKSPHGLSVLQDLPVVGKLV